MSRSQGVRGTRLFLVRHGESEGNALRRFSLDPDIKLTSAGIDQARAAGLALARFASPAHIVASPYHRARHTAALIAGEIGHEPPILIEDDLRERSIGELAGQPYDAMLHAPQYDRETFWEWCPPGGESLVDVRRRAGAVLDRLRLAHAGLDVVVVSHGGVMLALCAHVEGKFGGGRVARNCEILVVCEGEGGRLEVTALAGTALRAAPDTTVPEGASGG